MDWDGETERVLRDLDLDLDLDLEPQKSKSSRNRGMSTLKSDLDRHDFACRMSCRVGVQIRCSALKSGEYHRKTRYYRTNDVAWFTCLSSVKDWGARTYENFSCMCHSLINRSAFSVRGFSASERVKNGATPPALKLKGVHKEIGLDTHRAMSVVLQVILAFACCNKVPLSKPNTAEFHRGESSIRLSSLSAMWWFSGLDQLKHISVMKRSKEAELEG